MAHWRQWYRGVLIAIMFLVGMLAVGVVMPVVRQLAPNQSLRWNNAIILWWNRAVCRILNLRIRVTGLPDPGVGLTVANHISWLDILAIGSQRTFIFVAKEDVADWPVMGILAQGIGTLFIRRGDAEHVVATCDTMTWLLRRGERLMLFPEGTTTRGDQVLRFHSKLFQSAQRSSCRVQAIALCYSGWAAELVPFIGDDEFLPHLLAILKLKSIPLQLHYCPAMPEGLRRDQMAKASRIQIIEHLYAVQMGLYQNVTAL